MSTRIASPLAFLSVERPSAVERELIDSILAGMDPVEVAPSDPPPGGADEAWWQTRTIRGGLIRAACRSLREQGRLPASGIRLHRVRVTGDERGLLDLKFCRVRFPLEFIDCRICADVVLHHAELAHFAVRGGATRSILGNGLRVAGDFVLSAPRENFESDAAVPSRRPGRRAIPYYRLLSRRNDRVVGGSVHVRGEVQLRNAVIAGNLVMTGARVVHRQGNTLDAEGAHVGGSVCLDAGFRSSGEVNLVRSHIRGSLRCTNGHFFNPAGTAICADKVRIGGTVYLDYGFTALGEVRLIYARAHELQLERGVFVACRHIFSGQAASSGSSACDSDDALSFDGAEITGGAHLQAIRACGKVRLVWASIHSDLYMSGCWIHNPGGIALSARGVRVSGSVHFDRDPQTGKDFRSSGEVRLTDATIGDKLIFESSNVVLHEDRCPINGTKSDWGPAAVNATRVCVGGSVKVNGGTTNGVWNFSRGEVGKNFTVVNLAFAGSGVSGLVADGIHVKGEFRWLATPSERTKLDLSHAAVGRLRSSAPSVPPHGRISVKGLTYAYVTFDGSPEDVRRLWESWKGAQPFDPQPYQQLSETLRRNGSDDEAVRVAIAREDARREHGGLDRVSRSVNRALGVTLNHGYSPFRGLGIALLVVLASSVAFWQQDGAGVITPAREAVLLDSAYRAYGRTPIDYPRFQPVAYSLDSFLPVVDLHQESYWLPAAEAECSILGVTTPLCGGLSRLYLWLHIVVGWVLTTLIVVGFTGLIRHRREQ